MKDKYSDLFAARNIANDLSKKAVRGGTAIIAAEIGSSVLRISSVVVLGRLLIPEDFGLLAMVIALTVFAERFKDLGLGDATVQAHDISHEQVSSLFWINLTICVVIALVLTLLSKPIAWFYKDPRLMAITIAIASTFLFSGLVIQHQALLRRQFRFGTLAIIRLFSVIFSLILAIVLAYYGFGYWALVAREFSRSVFVFLGIWMVCPWRPDQPKRINGVKNLINFGKHITGFNIIYFLSHSIDKVLIGKLQGPYWVGLYTNALQLLSLPVSQLQYPVNTVALPALSALQTDPPKFREYYENMSQLLTFFSMPIVAFLALFGDMIIPLLLGTKWSTAVPIFQILAIGAFVEPIIHSTGPALVAYGMTKEFLILGVINSIFFIFCVAIGSFWGTIGTTVGYTIAVYIATGVSLSYGLRHTPILRMPLLRRIAPNCFCTISTVLAFLCLRYAVGWFFQPIWLPLCAIAGVSVYLGLFSIIPGGRQMLRDYWSYARHAMNFTKASVK